VTEGVREWREHRGPTLDRVGQFDVIDCSCCGFKHVVPIPTSEELETLYRETYYSIDKPCYFEHHREDLEWWNVVYASRYDTFEELLPPDRRRLLDVGSGPGYFLLHGVQRGWDTLGVEPSRQAAAHSRELGLTVVEAFLTPDLAGELGSFDVVHFSEVLEHLPDPAGMLTLARRMLRPGGLVCVVVPNDYNPFQHALRTVCGYRPWWVAPPHHLNYFDFASMRQLLQRTGFEVLIEETSFPIDLFLLMGDNYVGNDVLGRQCHGRRKRFEINLDRAGMRNLLRQLYRTLPKIGIGREVILFARGVS